MTIPVGAGTITGKITLTKESRFGTRLLARDRRSGKSFHAYANHKEGDFCFQFLPPGNYRLFAHDDDAGWCRLPDTLVNNQVREIGEHELQPGGRINGQFPVTLAVDRNVVVIATDSDDMSVVEFRPSRRLGNEFSIRNLWPGQWTVKLMKDQRLLGSKVVEVNGVEQMHCDLDVLNKPSGE
jgi:hypothetical protein